MRKLMMVTIVLCLLGLAGCNAAAGLGKDLTETAEALRDYR